MSLRRIFLVFSLGIGCIGAVVAVALIVLTSTLHDAAHELGTGVVESLRVGEELEYGLASLRDASEPAAVADGERLVRDQLAEAHRFVTTKSEQLALATLEQRVTAFVDLVEHGTPRPERRLAFDDALSATRALIADNIARSRQVEIDAARWHRVATLVGISAAILLVVGLALAGAWIQRRAFRPALHLVDVLERYATGDRAARADERAPVELQRLAHGFNALASALEEQRKMQLTLLAGVAHDLRNPLSALKMATAMLPADEPLPDERRVRQLFARVDKQISRLDRMVRDFLDASRVEAGELELRRERCDACELARATLDLFEPVAREHRLTSTLPEEPAWVRCDAMRIEQVLGNLVSNAIKYSPAGTAIDVAVKPCADGVEISVADHGIGIAGSELASIFEPFRRTGASKEAIPGVGLGLFVSRKLVEAHGGRLDVASTPGAGSTFTVQLPRA